MNQNKKAKTSSLSVYNYTDYRKFLVDYFEYRRKRNEEISLRKVCAAIGMNSAGHLSYILKGKTNVSKKRAEALAKFCRLRKRESAYFVTMVQFNQTKSHSKKKTYFETLISFRMSCVYKVSSHSYKFYDRWYHSAIRALCEFVKIRDNYHQISLMLIPSIKADEVKNSLKLLSELELIKPDEEGFFRPTSKYIDTGETQAVSTSVNNFLVSMLDKAKDSLDRFPKDERIFSWITLGIDKKGYKTFVQELNAFRGRIAELLEQSGAERVYQLNIQLFPLTKLESKLDSDSADKNSD
ncbi:MAG: TIGR02147 family protein [Fibrobacteria bacterium]|nr:TIGR02147 family protein [Fibrobacteria bacterium]